MFIARESLDFAGYNIHCFITDIVRWMFHLPPPERKTHLQGFKFAAFWSFALWCVRHDLGQVIMKGRPAPIPTTGLQVRLKTSAALQKRSARGGGAIRAPPHRPRSN
jgi:hypothetical protein